MDVFLKLFGKVAEPFPEKCTVSWVTSDLERALYYETLPYTNKMYSCRFYRSFLQLASEVQRKDYLKNVLPKPPVLLMSGTQDMVGDKGAYAKKKPVFLSKTALMSDLKYLTECVTAYCRKCRGKMYTV